MTSDPKIKTRETMWAERAVYCYAGDACDQHSPLWNVAAEGGKNGFEDENGPLILDASTFPAGTKITIEEPLCPTCGELRHFDSLNRGFPDKCDCGFDWIEWEANQWA